MELFNELTDLEVQPDTAASPVDLFAVREALESLTLMLAPFCPHIAEELWEQLGHSGGLLAHATTTAGPSWPQADPEWARKEELEISIQVNGRLRARVLAAPDVSEEDLRTAALADEKVRSSLMDTRS